MNLRLRGVLCVLAILSWDQSMAAEAQQESKVVLITGASRGIGYATAEYLAAKGYRVYAGVRKMPVFTTPQNINFEILDVTDLSTIRSAVGKIIKEEGRIDVVINNAGYALGGPVECLTMKEIQEQMDVNFFGVIRVCQEVLPFMRAQKNGQLINISSEQGVYGQPYGSLYTASKAALESFSEAMSLEVSSWNIRVAIVEPGLVATNFSVKLGSRQVEYDPYQKINEMIAKSLEIKREPSETCQTPLEIAQCLHRVIEDPEPRLRYQTSVSAEKTVARHITDLSGIEYSKQMKTELDLWLPNR